MDQSKIETLWINELGSGNFQLGQIVDIDETRNQPYMILWANYNGSAREVELFKRLLDLDPTLSADQLRQIHPYHFAAIDLTSEDDESLKDYEALELASTAYKPLNYLSAWSEDVDRLIATKKARDEVEEIIVESWTRPHWVQVEAEKRAENIKNEWKEAHEMFLRYWCDKVPFEKDEVFELLKAEKMIQHPETIKY